MSTTQRELPLFPLEQVVLFPGMPLPLRIFEERYKVMIGACQVTDRLFGVLLIRSGREVGAPAEPEQVGCTARMHRIDRLPDGQMNILCVGEQRFRLLGPAHVMPEGYLVGDVELVTDATTHPVAPELVSTLVEEFEKYLSSAIAPSGQPLGGAAPALPRDPAALSYRIGAVLQVPPRERQGLLELDDVAARIQRELALLKRANRDAPKTIGPFSMN
jgi:Lon protease-like protein